MKLIHLSDLHLGKRVNEFSLLEDQEYILNEILRIIDNEAPDAVLIAGDIYDKSVPPAEAVRLFDDFLFQLAERGCKVFIISGNHDSPERLAFGARLIRGSGIYLAPVYDGQITPVSLTDSYGTVTFFLLPFLKPTHVRRYFPEEEILSYTDAVKTAISAMTLDPAHRNVLITHQFVTGASRCDSEEPSVGGADNVDAFVLEPFDYVALGHLHGPQQAGTKTIRYCGSPLKYSFSEIHQNKSVTVAELKEKGTVSVRTVPLHPLRELREIRGTYAQISAKNFYSGTAVGDYLHIILTDEDIVPHAVEKLRSIYPNIMRLDYDNARTRGGSVPYASLPQDKKSPLALFTEFYEARNNRPLSEAQKEILEERIAQIWEDGE